MMEGPITVLAIKQQIFRPNLNYVQNDYNERLGDALISLSTSFEPFYCVIGGKVCISSVVHTFTRLLFKEHKLRLLVPL
jgi:hypothetical protein